MSTDSKPACEDDAICVQYIQTKKNKLLDSNHMGMGKRSA